MVIESLTNSTSKTIHVVNFDHTRRIQVGRAQHVEVRITDISVSRIHSSLILSSNGEVTITDNFSKFGTLVLLDKPLRCGFSPMGCFSSMQDIVYLQVGRALLSVACVNRYSHFETLCKQFCRCPALLGSKSSSSNEGAAAGDNGAAQNDLHFEEAARYFPQEFNWKFKVYQYED